MSLLRELGLTWLDAFALLLFIAAWIIVVNIAVDLAYALVDPRVGFERAMR